MVAVTLAEDISEEALQQTIEAAGYTFLSASASRTASPTGMTLHIEGMMCGHCERFVKTALEKLPQVAEAEVSHERGTAVVTLSAPAQAAELIQAVTAAGYAVVGVESGNDMP